MSSYSNRILDEHDEYQRALITIDELLLNYELADGEDGLDIVQMIQDLENAVPKSIIAKRIDTTNV